MSWRSGSRLFIEMWPLIKKHMPDANLRIRFTAKLLKVFTDDDMDPYDVEDVDRDIRAAMKLAGLELSEPDRYSGDDKERPDEHHDSREARPWWKFW